MSAGSSQVVLIGDPNCRVSAQVIGESRDNGILAPTSMTVLEPTIVSLSYLHRGSSVKPGDKVQLGDLSISVLDGERFRVRWVMAVVMRPPETEEIDDDDKSRDR